MSRNGMLGGALLLALVLAAKGGAASESPAPAASPSAAAPATTPRVTLAAAPAFGADASTGEGWIEVVARVSNAGAAPVRGVVELANSLSGRAASSDADFVARAPFHLEPGAEAVLHIPMRAGAYSAPSPTLTAIDDAGAKLAEASASFGSSSGPLLVDVDQPSRLSVVMRGWPIVLSWHPAFSPYVPAGSSVGLSVGSPAVDPVTGDPLLPEHSAAYSRATVVVIASHRLARLDGRALDALVGWVLSGGTLAVFATRPEDLRTGILPTLVGGTVASAPPSPALLTLPGVSRPGALPGLGAPRLTPPSPTTWPAPSPPDAGAGASATPIGWVVPARTTPFAPAPAPGPSPSLRGKLAGFTGGNLRASPYGATASYGLGQVHLLAFDPTSPSAIEDGWAHARLLDMLSDAWDRRALLVFPHGGGIQRSTNLYEVRRALDPNENFRPALGIAAILLVLYSIVTGPIVFLRAHKRGKPLEPLLWAPVASGACFALVVLVGLAGKGWSGRARHCALVEAAAGMSRGSVRRFRGLFSSETRAMRVRASEAATVLDVVTTDAHDQEPAVLRLDNDGASLESLTILPWQTFVVSEDGFADLRGGITVHEKPDGSVSVTNHTGRKLKDVIVWAPKSDASWFPSMADGETVLSTSGRTLFTPSARASTTAGLRTVHEIEASHFSTVLGGRASEDMTQAWSALGSAAGQSVDWWPDDVPVVLGEIVGGEGATSDTGLRVESDRLFFRVVGEGGSP